MEATIANTTGAHVTISDWRTGLDADGYPLVYEQENVSIIRANAAVALGDVVSLVVPTATVPPSVTPMASGTAAHLFYGVALEAGAAGDLIRVCKDGFCRVQVDSATPAQGNLVVVPTTANGVADVATAATTAEAPVGIFQGVKGSDTLAFAYIGRVANIWTISA